MHAARSEDMLSWCRVGRSVSVGVGRSVGRSVGRCAQHQCVGVRSYGRAGGRALEVVHAACILRVRVSRERAVCARLSCCTPETQSSRLRPHGPHRCTLWLCRSMLCEMNPANPRSALTAWPECLRLACVFHLASIATCGRMLARPAAIVQTSLARSMGVSSHTRQASIRNRMLTPSPGYCITTSRVSQASMCHACHPQDAPSELASSPIRDCQHCILTFVNRCLSCCVVSGRFELAQRASRGLSRRRH